jgi:SAM-dependent methyltransferase
MVDRALLRENLATAPSQPATALWRTIEIGHLLASGQIPTSGRGLDLGCGDGSIATLVRRALAADWELVGVDPDDRELLMARARGPYADLFHAKGSALPLVDASVDFVFSNSVLEHIEDLEPTLNEVARVLRPGGTFVFTVPGELFHPNLGAVGVLGYLATGTRDLAAYRRALDRRLAHHRYLPEDVWASLLGRRGLDVVHSSTYMTARETRRWALLSNGTSGILVRIAGSRKHPIDVQRTLRLRSSKPPAWLRAVGRVLGGLGAMGLPRSTEPAGDGSCLFVVARKVSP